MSNDGTSLPLSDIHLDPQVQPRQDGLDEHHVGTLRESGPDTWTPVVVVKDAAGYLLVDGYHRYETARQLGLQTITCEIRPAPENGDLRGLAFSLNVAHGKRLTTDDCKAEAARLLRNSDGNRSNAEIARHCLLSDKTVAAVRAELETTSEIPRLEARTGTDGKKRPATRRTKGAGADSSPNGGGINGRTMTPAPKQTTPTSMPDRELAYLLRLTDGLIDYLDKRGWSDDRATDDLTDAIVAAIKEHHPAAELKRVASLLEIATAGYRRAADQLQSAKADTVEEAAA